MKLKFSNFFRQKFIYSKYAYLSVIGGFLVQLTLGGVYTFGNMAPYMLQYMRNNTAPYSDINVGNSVWIFGLCVFGLGASMSLGGFLEPKLGTVITILMGSWIMSFGVFITYWTIQFHLALVIISYGLIVGLGVGLAYGVILGVPSQWFPNSKGLVTGIVVAGFGIGPIIFDFLQAFYINRNISKTTLTNMEHLEFSFILMAIVYAVLQLIGSVMIRRPVIQESDIPSSDIIFNFGSSKDDVNLKTHQLLLERDFWILWISYTLNSVVAVMILSLHKSFGFSLKISDIHLTYITASGALANGIGRIIWGYLNDRIPYKVGLSFIVLNNN